MTSENKRPLKGKSINYFPDSYTVIDIETTEKYVTPSNKIIEVGAIKIVDGVEIDPPFEAFINPHIPILNSNIHGITDDMVKDERDEKEVMRDYINFIGNDIIIGCNINSFDINLIYDSIQYHFNTGLSNDFIDIFDLAKKLLKLSKKPSVEYLAKRFNVDYSNHHRALRDCRIENEIFCCLRKEFPDAFNNITNKKPSKSNRTYRSKIKASDIKPQTDKFDKTHPFYNKNIVVTGEFNKIGNNREDVWQLLANLGAYNQEGITKKTDYLIIGTLDKPSSKISKADKYNDNGSCIKKIYEPEFYELLDIDSTDNNTISITSDSLLNLVFSGLPPQTEEEKQIRRIFGLPIKKQLVYYLNSRKADSCIDVKEFTVIEEFNITYKWYTFEVTMVNGEKRRVHSDYFIDMQKPTFVSDMKAQSGF